MLGRAPIGPTPKLRPDLGSVLADTPKSKNAKVTLVYQHELPNSDLSGMSAVWSLWGKADIEQAAPSQFMSARPSQL